ncbi:MAG: hypothetical protein FRX49_02294 [Trebouxia sp. A1-2]|nr:MAG: hypothetical protein FRX49_02294 [Trebouxia sp. A1-2]
MALAQVPWHCSELIKILPKAFSEWDMALPRQVATYLEVSLREMSRIAEGWSETKKRLVTMAFETYKLLIFGITH